MTITVKLPSGQEAQVTETVTLRLSSGEQVKAEGMPLRELAQKDWGNIVDDVNSLSTSAMKLWPGYGGGPRCLEIKLPSAHRIVICLPGTGPTFPEPPAPGDRPMAAASEGR
jgi:hypothetical protein